MKVYTGCSEDYKKECLHVKRYPSWALKSEEWIAIYYVDVEEGKAKENHN